MVAFLTVKQTAKLLNISERAVRKKIACSCLRYKTTNGVGGNRGVQYRVSLDSLPQKAQDKYNGAQREYSYSDYAQMTRKEREATAKKHNVVMDYKRFKEIHPWGDRLSTFIKVHNRERPDFPITQNQLHNWERKYNAQGIGGLLDRRGKGNKPETTIPEDVWNGFKSLWLKESKPSIQSCYDIIQDHYRRLGAEIPSIGAFKRQVKKIPPMTIIRYREGKKVFEDKCLPYNEIDYSDLYSNFEWVADHHVFDVLCVDEHGKVFRPWLSAWVDRKSRYPVGYVINKCAPNSDIVLDSFAVNGQ